MAALGLLLMLAAGALTAGVLVSNTNKISPEAFGVTLADISVGGLFLTGAVTALVFALGLWLLMRGLRRSRRRSVERRQIVRDTQEQQASLAAEKARLEQELAQERSRRSTSQVTSERTVVERQPVAGETEVRRTEGGSETVNDRPRLFRR